ncbi:MAG: Holliday junction ATP-dependent DNA helicase RuvA, partial [Bacillota bacterium]|nr:Holliday junction ATP-dependent DNA helicase RuvA [Bacillota bacterium]
MIRQIKGILAEVEQDQIIVDLHGLGLGLFVSAATRRRLPPPGEPVSLYTHLYVREDEWQLYGFADREEERLFQTLLKINGVGPRLALSI